MRLSPAQVRFVVETGLFDDAIRRAIAVVTDSGELIWHLSLAHQRDRSRLVTRNKQRRNW